MLYSSRHHGRFSWEMTQTRNEAFTLAGHTVQPGQMQEINLPAAKLYTHTPMDLTVIVANGRRPGPTLLICAAIHGDELNGVEIIRRLKGLSLLRRLRGTLIMVPIVNLFGFVHRSRYLPDRRDLNRCFPGREEGSLGARVAHLFFEEIVKRCTHIIDLHTGAVHRYNLPQIRAALDNEETSRMAHAFSIPVIINAGLIESTLRAEAQAEGIPVITYEAGEALRLDEKCVVTGVRGCVSVMRGLEMLPPRRSRASRWEPYVASSTRWLRAGTDGMFRAFVDLGARVAKGDVLGVVASPLGDVEERLLSPAEGIVICVNNLPLVNEGEALIHIARFGEVTAVEDDLVSYGVDLENDPLYEVESVQDQELG